MKGITLKRINVNWRGWFGVGSDRGFKLSVNQLDWAFIRSSALVSGGMFIARIFGLAFSLILARILSPDEFGTVQYTLAAANILAIGIHPFGQHVIARFISSRIEDKEQLAEVLHHASMAFLVLLVLSLWIAAAAAWASEKLGYEVVVVVGGIALFYGYWGVARGYLAVGRLTAAYLGSNVVQLLAMLLLVGWLRIQVPAVALLIYGLSYLPVLIWLQWRYGLPLYFQGLGKKIQGTIIRPLLRFAAPVTLSHAAFMLFISIDLLCLTQWASSDSVGRYALAKTLATAFSFIPMGIATLLMPRIAMKEQGSNRQIIYGAVGLSLLVNLILLGLLWMMVGWFVLAFFGDEYLAPTMLYLTLAITSIMMGTQSIVASAYLGRNRPGVETGGRIVAAVVAIAGCWFWVPLYGMMGAATSVLLGSLIGLAVYGIYAIRLFQK